MRIQHNIMAMGAYRNYTNNISAMKKNLEKLSSGYKINRAGDDAAGLAISEKMRAQITGLETAQKNAKDGISLVQTAEGALTEVHDMLNRMVELASQSANGTYDNTTDRAQMQKEVNQLLDEINRIADSANFNGIKLLDGTMDGTPIAGAITNIVEGGSDATSSFLPDLGAVLGVNTVKHSGSADAKAAQFGISLHNVTYSNDDANGSMTIQFGNDKIKISGGGSAAVLDTGDLLSKLAVDATAGLDNPREMQIGGSSYAVEGSTLSDQLNSWVEQYNTDTANTDLEASVVDGSKIKFTAKTAGTAGNAAVNAMAGNLTGTPTTVAGVDGVKAKMVAVVDVSGLTGTMAAGDKITIGGTTYELYSAGTGAYTGTDTGIDIDTETVDATWIENKIRDAVGDQSALGFASPSGITSDAFSYEALQAGKFTGTMPTMPTVTLDGGNGGLTGTVTVAWADGAAAGAGVTVAHADYNAGVDEVTASVTSDIQTKVTGELEIAGYKMTTTKSDPTEMLQEFINSYNQHNSDFRAEWNDDNNGIKFTATSNGEKLGGGTNVTKGTDDATNFKFEATGADGGASELGREGTLNARQILDAIMAGKAEIDTGTGTFRPLGQADINGSVTLSDGAKYKISAEGDTLTFTQLENDVDADGAFNATTLDRQVTITSTVNATTGKNMHAGDYQKSTTFNTPSDDVASNRLASTFFTTDGSKIKDKASIFIGGKNYQFTVDEDAAKADATKVFIGDLLDEDGNINSADTATMTKINERITVAAKDNEVYTVGYDTTRLTFTEKVGYTTGSQEYDLTKLSEIERSLGYAEADTPNEKGKGLTLQIGDTADDFNKLTVNIKDMHAKSLGLEGLSVANQDDAAKAVDAIKAAINSVSDVRGTLGATQNRLDHTINNLGVMTENIQDAESSIRDVDVAEEMMAYTKNNILIQSAQAMLAQANQVPQGVLQLLQ